MIEIPIDENRPPVLMVLGSTGNGKTSAALMMPGGEAVCADRFTAWAELDIGSAKPTSTERARMPHHLINIFHLGELAGHEAHAGYVRLDGRHDLAVLGALATKAIGNISQRDTIPVIVGGSTSLLNSIRHGYKRMDSTTVKAILDNSSERDLRERCDLFGIPYFEYGLPLDAIRSKIYEQSTVESIDPLPNVYTIGIRHDMRHVIHRVHDRLDQMWEEGLPGEVERLVATYGWVWPLRIGTGYREFMPNPDGTTPTPDKIRRNILANTIGLIWAQSKEFEKMEHVRFVRSPEEAVSVGQEVIDLYRSTGEQAASQFNKRFIYDCN